MKKCASCKKSIDDDQNYCPNCGAPQTENGEEVKTEKVEGGSTYHSTSVSTAPKSKIAAGILGILLGGFGVHNFYLGYNSKAVAQLLITILSCGMLSFVSGIWGLIEGILILTGGITTDGDGNELGE